MIKIRSLRARELGQVLNFLERFSDKAFEYSDLEKLKQLYIPLQWVSQALPLSWHFMPGIYVAVANKKVLGLIWMVQDGQKNNRWKIDQLLIHPNEYSYDFGAQLIHYVINRYGAEGVQTFLAQVDHESSEAIGLLKSCGFRRCTERISYVHERLEDLATGNPEEISGLREAHWRDANHLVSLYNTMLPVDIRMSLEKIPADFSPSLFRQFLNRFSGEFKRRWVVEDSARDILFGSLELSTQNYQDFAFQGIVSNAWKAGYEDLIRLAARKVLKNTSNGKLYTHLYEFQKEEMAFLEAAGFQRLQTHTVLVKDYWIPLQDKDERSKAPLLLFPGKTSPACLEQSPNWIK
jgi:ribosomal protein S18 acetylase RimI-like enzyme